MTFLNPFSWFRSAQPKPAPLNRFLTDKEMRAARRSERRLVLAFIIVFILALFGLVALAISSLPEDQQSTAYILLVFCALGGLSVLVSGAVKSSQVVPPKKEVTGPKSKE